MPDLHIAIAAPIATEYLAQHFPNGGSGLPKGSPGAPLTGVLIDALLRQGYRVSAVTLDRTLPSGSSPVVKSVPGLDFYICPARRRAWRPNGWSPGYILDFFARERALLTDSLRSCAPDIIHAHWTYEYALAAIQTGCPHVVTCHDDPLAVLRYTRSPYRALRLLMAKQVFRQAKNLTAVSSYMAAAASRYTPQRVAVVPNPVARYVLQTGEERAESTSRSFAMVNNGWDRRKNPEIALRAFARYRQSVPHANLHLFGNGYGAGEAAYQWASAHNLVEGVHFHGALPHRELVDRLDALDVLLHPALEESFGVCVAEAMALGLPVIAGARSGAVPWVVGSESASSSVGCAILVDVSDESAMLDAMHSIFDANFALRSVAGRERATKHFSAEAVTAAYLHEYRLALGV